MSFEEPGSDGVVGVVDMTKSCLMFSWQKMELNGGRRGVTVVPPEAKAEKV